MRLLLLLLLLLELRTLLVARLRALLPRWRPRPLGRGAPLPALVRPSDGAEYIEDEVVDTEALEDEDEEELEEVEEE